MKFFVIFAALIVISMAAQKKVTLVSCVAPGWASQNGGTTGGGDNVAETTVSTYAQLKAAIKNASIKLIKVIGTITITARLTLKDQTGKTIYGTAGAKLVSTDQTKDGPGAYDTDGWDNLILDDCQNVWIDHCEFRDGVDGNFDIKNKSDFITVSYTKFQYVKAPKPGGSGGTNDHRFSNLIGSGDGAIADAGKLNVAFVRCWWAPGCKERMPRVRFGKVHVLNSYFNSFVSNKCIAAGFQANILVEKNVFENVKNPISLMSGFTAVTQTGNSFINVTGNTSGSGTVFTPPYSINELNVTDVRADVTANAGATLDGNYCGAF
ncbi:pectate lyase-like isoform X1 [Sitodiplosis mosellana]|uniref:pectate lyase-like isoform X1 n=1 Tax=Sitodiplosis mosellana TaxID=263140 RepID=UPI002443AE74|nr:pectate lyase-like isoform X1 [Sitodiplosis mosellana]